MSSDCYEYEKSNLPQNIDQYSPYVEKQQSSFVNDLNNSVYANSSLSLVQFDLCQIFNSSSVSDPGDMYLVVPICMVASCRTNSAVITTASPGASQLCSLKSNFIHLIAQADIQVGGHTLESSQPHLNIVKHSKMISELSVNDLATIGPTLGFSDRLDTTRSIRYVSATEAGDGNSAAAVWKRFVRKRAFCTRGNKLVCRKTSTSSHIEYKKGNCSEGRQILLVS